MLDVLHGPKLSTATAYVQTVDSRILLIMSTKKIRLPILGWREWVRLPDLRLGCIKAKIDTGARSSCLHAFDIEIFDREGELFVRFKVHPQQRRKTKLVEAEAKILEFREVRSSSGHSEKRPVICTTIRLLGQEWPIDLTLSDRGEMGFRMLIGREALRSRFLVDAEKSFLAGRPGKLKKSRAKNKLKKTPRDS